MKASKSSRAMKLAHQIKSCFKTFSEALKAAWMYINSGRENLNITAAAISYYCDRSERTKREEQLVTKQAAFVRKQAAKNQPKSTKNNAALKANKEKMNALSSGKKIKQSFDDSGFYSVNREWSDYEMDVHL